MAVAACGGGADDGGSARVSQSSAGPTPVTVRVDMRDVAFVAPGGGDDITIALGDTVTWVNLDDVPHTVTSTAEPPTGTPFDSGLLERGESFSFVADARGTWVYYCEVHAAVMRDARILVR